jgi:ankyrin repeat protein
LISAYSFQQFSRLKIIWGNIICPKITFPLQQISTLLQNGADIHAQDYYGQDALHMAAWNGHYLALETHLDNAANPNARDHEGQTALHKAAAQGHQDVVTYLAQKGADLHICDNASHTPVDLAILNGHDALKWPMLHNWVGELDSDDYRRPPLHQAVRYGTDDEVAQILDEGHDINEVDWWGRPALSEAARCGLVSSVALLLESGADVAFQGPTYSSFQGPETACSLAADGYYVNYSRGLRKKDGISALKNKESALAIIQMLLQRHVAVYGLVEGLRKPLAMLGHPEQVSAVAEQDQDEELLLQLATTLVLEEGGFRDSKRPRASGAKFE